MPRGNGTGPAGVGSMTGRGMGFCAGYQTPGYANSARVFGGGMGQSRGGRGFRNMFYAIGVPGWARFGTATPIETPEAEKTILENQAAFFKQQLDAVTKRLGEIGTDR